MGQDYRVSKAEEAERLMAMVREAHEAHEAQAPAPPPVEDRVERNPAAFNKAPRVDVHKALTQNLEARPFKPESVGQSKNGAGRIVVKAEARSSDFHGMPPRPDPREQPAVGQAPRRAPGSGDAGDVTGGHAEAPEPLHADEAREQGIDDVEHVYYPHYKNPTTSGAVDELKHRPPGAAKPAARADVTAKKPTKHEEEAAASDNDYRVEAIDEETGGGGQQRAPDAEDDDLGDLGDLEMTPELEALLAEDDPSLRAKVLPGEPLVSRPSARTRREVTQTAIVRQRATPEPGAGGRADTQTAIVRERATPKPGGGGRADTQTAVVRQRQPPDNLPQAGTSHGPGTVTGQTAVVRRRPPNGGWAEQPSGESTDVVRKRRT